MKYLNRFSMFFMLAMLIAFGASAIILSPAKAVAAPTAFGVSTFRNVSSSTKPQATASGEMHHNGTYAFLNISGSGTHTHWRRWTTGTGF